MRTGGSSASGGTRGSRRWTRTVVTRKPGRHTSKYRSRTTRSGSESSVNKGCAEWGLEALPT
eukprot:15915205-Heterocapsa_arctica.AAC.1